MNETTTDAPTGIRFTRQLYRKITAVARMNDRPFGWTVKKLCGEALDARARKAKRRTRR